MSDIQKARDVLAKWRKMQSWFPGPWGTRHEQPGRANWSDVVFDRDGDSLFTYDEEGGDEFSPTRDAGTNPTIALLIVGTAGNPDLLDGVESLLATAQRADLRALGLGPLLYDAERIAETIVAADERMSA